MITERDRKILDYLKENGAIDSITLCKTFFDTSMVFARKRLEILIKRGYIKREKHKDDNRLWVYSIKEDL